MTIASNESLTSAPGIMLVPVLRVDAQGRAWVLIPGIGPRCARAVLGIDLTNLGQRHLQAVVAGDGGDLERPIILGIIGDEASISVAAATAVDQTQEASPKPAPELLIDGQRIEIAAQHEIVLRCGDASITLTASGRILLRGSFISSWSKGTNRIKGGSVQIN